MNILQPLDILKCHITCYLDLEIEIFGRKLDWTNILYVDVLSQKCIK